MKKYTFTPKAKKIAIISGAAAVCVCALSVILYQANSVANVPAKAAGTTSSSETTTEAPVSVASITGTAMVSVPSGMAGTGSAFTPSSGKNASAPLTGSASQVSAPPKPVIQGDSVNGKQPTNSALTDKTKKPSYVTPPKAPTSSNSTTTKSSSSTQKSGGSGTGTGDNDPIFGDRSKYHTDRGQGTVMSGDGDIDKQVGIMD